MVVKSFVWVCASLLATSSGLAQGGQVQSGWKIQIDVSGVSSVNRCLYGNPLPGEGLNLSSITWETFNDLAWYYGAAGRSFGLIYVDGPFDWDDWWQPYSLNVTNAGQINAKLKWEPGSVGAPSPTKAYYRIHSVAGGTGLTGSSGANGLGHPGTGTSASTTSDGWKSFKVDTSGGGQISLQSISPTSSASGTWTFLEPSAGISYTLTTLTPPFISSAVEPSYFRTSSTGSARTPRTRDADLGMVVDSIATWLPNEQKWQAWGTVTANQSMWSVPHFDWLFQDGAEFVSGELAQGNTGYKSVTFQKKFTQQLSNRLNTFSDLKVNVTDSSEYDPLVADNVYRFLWHMPYENWIEFRPREEYWRQPAIVDGDPAGGAWQGDSYSFRWNRVSPAWGNFVDLFPEYMGTLADIIPNPYVSMIAASLGFLVGQLPAEWVNGNADFNVHWNEATSTFSPNKDEAQKNRYRMTASVHIGMKRYFLDLEKYDTNGYVAQELKTVKAEDGRMETHGHFVYVPDPGDPPPPNGGG